VCTENLRDAHDNTTSQDGMMVEAVSLALDHAYHSRHTRFNYNKHVTPGIKRRQVVQLCARVLPFGIHNIQG